MIPHVSGFHLSPRYARTVIAAMAIVAATGCSETTRTTDNNGIITFDGMPVLVTARHEQGLSAPSNGSVALLPLIQFDGAAPGPGSTVVVQLVSSTGARVGGPINLGTNSGDLPLAAFDGTNFLVVYQLSAAGGVNLYGQFFGTSGAATSAAFEITTTDDSPSVWSVTYGAGTYLVTYHRVIDGVFTGIARFVSPTGTVGSEVVFNDLGGMSAAAFDGTRFLIAYARQGTQVGGRFLHPNGTLDPAFTIDGSANKSNGGILVAYTGTNHVVVFADSTMAGGWDVFAQAVSTSGTLVGTAATLSATAGTQLPRGVLPEGGNVLVTWLDGDSQAQSTHAAFVSGIGTIVGPARVVFSANPGAIAGPISSRVGGAQLAVVSRYAGNWDVYVKLVTLSP